MNFGVDRSRCVGAAVCVELVPEVFELDNKGLASVINDVPSERLWKMIRLASTQCPSGAIFYED